MCPLVAVLDAQNAGALVSQCGVRLSVPVDAADLLDELEAGAIPNDEDVAKIKRHNRCPRWGAWHRTPPPSWARAAGIDGVTRQRLGRRARYRRRRL